MIDDMVWPLDRREGNIFCFEIVLGTLVREPVRECLDLAILVMARLTSDNEKRRECLEEVVELSAPWLSTPSAIGRQDCGPV